MDSQYVTSGIMILIGIAGWFMKKTISDLEIKSKEHSEELKRIQREYLHRDDFKDFKLELRSWFDEIKTDIRGLRQPHV